MAVGPGEMRMVVGVVGRSMGVYRMQAGEDQIVAVVVELHRVVDKVGDIDSDNRIAVGLGNRNLFENRSIYI